MSGVETQMKYVSVVCPVAVAGLLVPALCVATFGFLTYAGLDPMSKAAGMCELVAALIWPTYTPYGLVLGANGFTWDIAPLLAILAIANAIVYLIVASVLWWAWIVPKRRITMLLPIGMIVVYWGWAIVTFHPR